MFASVETATEAERDLNIKLVKKWLPAEDARTRPAHAAMANKPYIPMDDKFNVGGEMLSRPGDPAGSAGNVINCRCVLRYKEQQFEIEDGN